MNFLRTWWSWQRQFLGLPWQIEENLRIVLVYDYADWVLAKWAQAIMDLYHDRCTWIPLSFIHGETDRKHLAQLLSRVDYIFHLLPHGAECCHKIAPQLPEIITIHHWIRWEGYANQASRAMEIVTGSHEWRERMEQEGIAASRITVVHGFAAPEFFVPGPPRLPSNGKFTIGFFAKHDSNENDRKGLRHFIALAEELRRRNLQEYYRFIISGEGWESFSHQMRDAGLEVHAPGFVPENQLPALYRCLDAYLVLSEVEGGPVTVAEAMACGCLVCSTRVGLARDVLIHDFNGIALERCDSHYLAALLEELRNAPQKCAAIASRARHFAEEQLQPQTTLAPLDNMLQRLAAIDLQPRRSLRIDRLVAYHYTRMPKIGSTV